MKHHNTVSEKICSFFSAILLYTSIGSEQQSFRLSLLFHKPTDNSSAPRMKPKLLLTVLLVFVEVKWIVAAADDNHGGKDQLHQMRHLSEDQPCHSKGLDDKKSETFAGENSELDDPKWRINSKRSGSVRTPTSHNSSTSMKQPYYYYSSLLPLDAFACLLLLLAIT